MTGSLYDEVGESFFEDLVAAFYAAVEDDPALRPLYPADLTDPARRLTLFLIQYWGGPRTYQEERGHPRLRLRHAPFDVTATAREAWLRAMNAGLETVSARVSAEGMSELRSYFDTAAHQLRNA